MTVEFKADVMDELSRAKAKGKARLIGVLRSLGIARSSWYRPPSHGKQVETQDFELNPNSSTVYCPGIRLHPNTKIPFGVALVLLRHPCNYAPTSQNRLVLTDGTAMNTNRRCNRHIVSHMRNADCPKSIAVKTPQKNIQQEGLKYRIIELKLNQCKILI